ncbi:hypothetical protein NE237_001108 [Protea cynaroides]|uniref:Uncharacterized protein n=1 Tax=Protea cynaroides TaxID=273540 RepID=A0A9Q0QY37_9MAGN|nr:hypothetical protein NE237_001108 [Protea cynaroides]
MSVFFSAEFRYPGSLSKLPKVTTMATVIATKMIKEEVKKEKERGERCKPKWTSRLFYAIVVVLVILLLRHHPPDEAARARYQNRVFNIIDNVLEWSPRLALSGMMEKQQNVVNAIESNSSNLQDKDPPQLNIEQHNQRVNGDEDNKDDIEQLIELLGLSELGLEEDDEKEEREKKVGDDKDDRSEPLSLAHLLIGRVACAWQDGDGLGGLEFPSTIEEFLQNDPPNRERFCRLQCFFSAFGAIIAKRLS